MKPGLTARAALHAFPANLRVVHGEEMLDTFRDVSSTRGRYVRELIGLVQSGMRARGSQTARAGARRLIADGVCLGAVWVLTLFLSSELGNRIRGVDPLGPWHPLSYWSLALLGAALALALIGYDRLAGATALLFVATLLANPEWRDMSISRRELMLIPVLCFVTMGLAPRLRKPDRRRLAWLALTGALAVASSTSDDPTAAILILALLVLLPFSLAMLRSDPRFAIACAVPATAFGIHMVQDPGGPGVLGVLFLCAAPLTLAITVKRTRHLQARVRI
ncbi:MAG: hypothetical protein ACJ762_00015 [Solirubrobacteraceae bacterium]